MIMTRKEEIIKEAEEFSKSTWDFIDDDYVIPFRHGAEWADKTMIEKAVKYLSGLTRCTVSCIGEDVYGSVLSEEQLEDFKKAMEE